MTMTILKLFPVRTTAGGRRSHRGVMVFLSIAVHDEYRRTALPGSSAKILMPGLL